MALPKDKKAADYKCLLYKIYEWLMNWIVYEQTSRWRLWLIYIVDCQETLHLMEKMNTIIILLWIMIVKNVFLQRHLNDEVYIFFSPSYEEILLPNTISKLKKSSYGLKQSS